MEGAFFGVRGREDEGMNEGGFYGRGWVFVREVGVCTNRLIGME